MKEHRAIYVQRAMTRVARRSSSARQNPARSAERRVLRCLHSLPFIIRTYETSQTRAASVSKAAHALLQRTRALCSCSMEFARPPHSVQMLL